MARSALTEPGRTVDGINHGMSGYTYYRCRCLTCRGAMTAYSRRRKAEQAREQKALLKRVAELEAQLAAQ